MRSLSGVYSCPVSDVAPRSTHRCNGHHRARRLDPRTGKDVPREPHPVSVLDVFVVERLSLRHGGSGGVEEGNLNTLSPTRRSTFAGLPPPPCPTNGPSAPSATRPPPHGTLVPTSRAAAKIRCSGYDNAPTASDSYTVPSPVASTSATPADEPKKSNKSRKAPKELDSFGGRKDLGGLSKSLHRILNAEAVRDEYQQNKKRKREDEEKATAKKGNKVSSLSVPQAAALTPGAEGSRDAALRVAWRVQPAG